MPRGPVAKMTVRPSASDRSFLSRQPLVWNEGRRLAERSATAALGLPTLERKQFPEELDQGAIVSVLGQHKDGLSRPAIAGQIGDDVLATIGVKRDELADKLRQPLGELVGEKKLHTVGEKRLMKPCRGEKAGGSLAR